MGVSRRIDDDAIHLVKIGLLDSVHQGAFMIGLEEGDLDA